MAAERRDGQGQGEEDVTSMTLDDGVPLTHDTVPNLKYIDFNFRANDPDLLEIVRLSFQAAMGECRRRNAGAGPSRTAPGMNTLPVSIPISATAPIPVFTTTPSSSGTCSTTTKRSAIIGMTESPGVIIPHPDNGLELAINSVLTRTLAHRKSRKVMKDSDHAAPVVAVLTCVIDLDALKAEAEKKTKKKGSKGSNKLKKEAASSSSSEVAVDSVVASASASSSSSTVAPDFTPESTDSQQPSTEWPSEIADKWKIYCPCGICWSALTKFTFSISTVIHKGRFQMPLKAHAFAHSHHKTENILLKVTISSNQHTAFSKGGTITTSYDPTRRHSPQPSQPSQQQPHPQLKIIPHRLSLMVPSPNFAALLDRWDTYMFVGSRKDLYMRELGGGRQPFMRIWTGLEKQRMCDLEIGTVAFASAEAVDLRGRSLSSWERVWGMCGGGGRERRGL